MASTSTPSPWKLIDCTENSGDTAFIIVSAALVMLMTPALAFFEAGLVRSKNVLSIMMQCFAGMVLLTCLFYVIGFSLVFGADQYGIVGDLSNFLWLNMPAEKCFERAPTIPSVLYGLYENMFAVITPLLITGAWAERMSFRSFVFFIVAWSLLVYYPVAHWIWGDGWLQRRGVLDFAGGITVHTTAGTAALVYLGKRSTYGLSHVLKPHSVPLTMIGVALLMIGWQGFNAGSVLRSGGSAALVAANTHIAACSCGLVGLLLSWRREGRPHTVDVGNWIIAGLAGITPVCGYCSTQSAFVIGILLGFAADLAVTYVVEHWHIDDALEVSAVHGVTGAFGSIAIGFVASKAINPSIMYNGLFYGGSGALLGWQVLAVLLTIAWTAVFTLLILKAADALGFHVRVTKKDEDDGLDISQHEGFAYLFSRLAVFEDVYESVVERPDDHSPLLPVASPLAAATGVGSGASFADLAQMARHGELTLLRTAVAAGAQVHARGPSGRTLVHEAAECNQVAIVRYLVAECRLETGTPDSAGRTALDLARERSAAACATFLSSHTIN